MTAPTEHLPPEPMPEPLSAATRRRAVTACLLGNLFELFDFGVYGYFAVQIGKAIFPSADPVVSILASFAAYGVGFLMRPVGAMVLGSYGDRRGRKAALALTITLMAVATGLTGLVPSYAAIGIWAPVCLVLCRLVQGFSTGGEWGGATTFLVEHAPPGRRGFYGSLQQISTGLAQLLAIGSALFLNAVLSTPDLESWGWRLPFLLGFILAPIGYYLRSRVEESPEYTANVRANLRERRAPIAPLRSALTIHRGAVLTCFGLTVIWTVSSYVFITFLPTYATHALHMAPTTALAGTIFASIANILVVPLAGLASDRWGRAPMVISAVGFAIFSVPLFLLLAHTPSFAALTIVAVTAGALFGLYNGAAPAALCTLFPTAVRYTALSVGYNGAVMIFGGFAPFISTVLVRETGSPIAPSFYVTACALVSLAVLVWPRRRQAFAY